MFGSLFCVHVTTGCKIFYCTLIEAINKFVRVSFKKESSVVDCTFMNQPLKDEKGCKIMYGPPTSSGCTSKLPLSADLTVTDSLSMMVDVDLRFMNETNEICFSATATSGKKIVHVKGIFGSGMLHLIICKCIEGGRVSNCKYFCSNML